MDRRLLLHEELCSILGSRNVYFQPPESIKLQFPCIVYSRYDGYTLYANDNPYNFRVIYRVIFISKDPDAEVVKKIGNMPRCRFERNYTADNLNHDAFIIHY